MVRPSSYPKRVQTFNGLIDVYRIMIKSDDCRYTEDTAKAHGQRNFLRNPEMFYRWET